MRNHACDGCGAPVLDRDEIACRRCKPSLMRSAMQAEIDAAYWRFCRCARALPPVLAVPHAYAYLAAHPEVRP